MPEANDSSNTDCCCCITKKSPPPKQNSQQDPLSQKRTYSAQHNGSNQTFRQTTFTNNQTPVHIPQTGFCNCCNVAPLYDVSSKNPYNTATSDPMRVNNLQYAPCPCSSPPPPPATCTPKDDLWDLQFCRWWGWNWVRKREEMMNQKKAEMKKQAIRTNTDTKVGKVQRKKNDFFSWCRKLCKRGRNKKREFKTEEKKQLQELYNTPCSSVTFNNCPCPLDDWESRSLNLEGDYECYCSTARQTSMSTIIVQNKTRRQTYKQNTRKHKSWVCEKNSSSSSDECRPCTISVDPQKLNQTSDEDSIEYLSMRMASLKSDCDDNSEGCHCACSKVKQEKAVDQQNNPTALPPEKKQGTHVCCPCIIKVVCDKPTKCPCHKSHKERPSNMRYQHSKKPEDCCCRIPKPKPTGLPSRKTSPPPCKCVPDFKNTPMRIPRFRRLSPNVSKVEPEYRRRPKRKNPSECPCQIQKEYVVCCSCQPHPRKKVKKSEKSRKVYYCRCCCCCCCHCKDKTKQPEDGTKVDKPKPEKILKDTTDKSVDCYFETNANQGNPFTKNFDVLQGEPTQNNFIRNTMGYSISKDLEKGLYTSPFTRKLYPLTTQVATPIPVSHHETKLPKPIDIQDKKFSFKPVLTSLLREEHEMLLSSICEAMLSSRHSNEESYVSYHNSKCKSNSQVYSGPPHGDYWFNVCNPFVDNVPTGEPYVWPPDSEELDVHNYEDEQQSNSSSSFNDFSSRRGFSKNNLNTPVPPSISDTSIFNNVTVTNRIVPSISEITMPTFSNNVEIRNLSVLERKKRDLFRKPSSGRKTRIPVRNGSRSPSAQSRRETPTPVNSTAQHLSTQRNTMEGLGMSGRSSNKNDSNKKLAYWLDSPLRINEPGLATNGSVLDRLYAEYENYLGERDSYQEKNVHKTNNPHTPRPLTPFRSPRNWSQPPQTPAVSLTGLFSAVHDSKADTRYGTSKRKDFCKTDTQQLKKERFYNVLFAKDRRHYCEDFPNLPCNFSPVLRHAGGYPSVVPPVVFQALPLSEIREEGTQTNGSSRTVHQKHMEKEMCCMSLNKDCPKTLHEQEKEEELRRINLNESLTFMNMQSQLNKHTKLFNEESPRKEMRCINSNKQNLQSPRPGTSKETTTDGFVQNPWSDQTRPFIAPNHSEREISSQFLKPDDSKTSLQISSSLGATPRPSNFAGATCFIPEQKPQTYSSFVTPNNLETLTSIVRRTSEHARGKLQSYNSISDGHDIACECTESDLLPANERRKVSRSLSPLFINHAEEQTQNLLIHTTTSPFKFIYTKEREKDRSETEDYTTRKVPKKESPFSMFMAPVRPEETVAGPSAMQERASLSRPERKVVVNKPNKLKVREKRWRY